ncbi:MAG: Rpn family recombination-promoting nuclease/putative transposase [Lachnospiraceae bacterium]|nr:Rpn family recombination-promoting nuclease/putative transposase [Lachnospiraceae bacterium]
MSNNTSKPAATGNEINATVINPILPGESITDKTVILDVNVIFNNDSRINLEMQVVNEHNWTERSTVYACRNFSKINKGTKYSVIRSVFQIGFLDFTLFPAYPSFYSTYQLCNIKDHHIFSDKLTIGVVDLTNIALATPEDRRYNIDKWAKLFKSQTWEDIKMLAAQDVNINAAATTLYRLSEDERIQQECEAREDYLLREQDLTDRITELQNSLAEKDIALAEKDIALAEKDKEIARLKALSAEKTQ